MFWTVISPSDRSRAGNEANSQRIRSWRVAMVTGESPRSTRVNFCKGVQLAIKANRRLAGRQRADAAQPSPTEAHQQPGRMLRGPVRVAQPDALANLSLELRQADMATVVTNGLCDDEQGPGHALQRRAGVPVRVRLPQIALASLGIRSGPIAPSGDRRLLEQFFHA